MAPRGLGFVLGRSSGRGGLRSGPYPISPDLGCGIRSESFWWDPTFLPPEGCVQRGEGSTGSTYMGIRNFLERSRPLVSILENVVELSEKTEDMSAESDLEFIIQDLDSIGFQTRCFRFNATAYGSRCDRERLYFVVVDCRPGVASQRMFSLMANVLNAMKTEPASFDDFIIPDDALGDWAPPQEPPKSKRSRENEAWVDRHMDIYREYDVYWPPQLSSEMSAVLNMWGERAAQVGHFLHAMFPPGDAQWQFVDLNHTLERTLRFPPAPGKPLHCPWRYTCPTLTSMSKILIRRQTALPGGALVLRALHPLEAFRLMGWDLPWWTKPLWSADVTPELLTNMAGNAFSGYAVTPVLIAALGSVGARLLEPQVADAGAQDVSCGSDSDSACSAASRQ